MADEETSELRSGITSGFNKTLNEALQIGPRIRYFLLNRVRPVLLSGVLKGGFGTPGLLAAVSAEKDTVGNVRLSVSSLSMLRGKTIVYNTVTASNATVALYTVPTGKIFYVLELLASYNATGNHIGVVHVGADSDNRLLSMGSDITAVYHPTDRKFAHIVFPIPIPFVAGTVINALSDNANMSFYPTIVGYLEDAET